MIEEGVVMEDVLHGKGGDSHKATVVGDTVGDPFKDTSGPSLNILLKLMAVVALVIAPTIALDKDQEPLKYMPSGGVIEQKMEAADLPSAPEKTADFSSNKSSGTPDKQE
jgi:hypothetical protein